MKVSLLVLIEVTYAILTRVALARHFPNEMGREAVTTLVHGVYDAVECFGPYVQNPVPGWSLIVLEAAALAILARWMWKNAESQ